LEIGHASKSNIQGNYFEFIFTFPIPPLLLPGYAEPHGKHVEVALDNTYILHIQYIDNT